MQTENIITTTINGRSYDDIIRELRQYAKIENGQLLYDLADLNDGCIYVNTDPKTKVTIYSFISHNWVVTVDAEPKKRLFELLEAYLQDADTFDEVVDKYKLI